MRVATRSVKWLANSPNIFQLIKTEQNFIYCNSKDMKKNERQIYLLVMNVPIVQTNTTFTLSPNDGLLTKISWKAFGVQNKPLSSSSSCSSFERTIDVSMWNKQYLIEFALNFFSFLSFPLIRIEQHIFPSTPISISKTIEQMSNQINSHLYRKCLSSFLFRFV